MFISILKSNRLNISEPNETKRIFAVATSNCLSDSNQLVQIHRQKIGAIATVTAAAAPRKKENLNMMPNPTQMTSKLLIFYFHIKVRLCARHTVPRNIK